MYTSSETPSRSVWSTIDEVRRSNVASFSGGGASESRTGRDASSMPRTGGGRTHICTSQSTHSTGTKRAGLDANPSFQTSGRRRIGRIVSPLSQTDCRRTRRPSSSSNGCNRPPSRVTSPTGSAILSASLGVAVARKCQQLVGWVRNLVATDLTSSMSSDSLSTETRGSLVSEPETNDENDSVDVMPPLDAPLARRRPNGASDERCRCAREGRPAGHDASSSPSGRSGRVCRSCNHRKRTATSYCSDCGSYCGEDDDDGRGATSATYSHDRRHIQWSGDHVSRTSQSPSPRYEARHGALGGISRTISKVWNYIKDEVLASSSSSGTESDTCSTVESCADAKDDVARVSGPSLPTRRPFSRGRDVAASTSKSPPRRHHSSFRRPSGVTRETPGQRHMGSTRLVAYGHFLERLDEGKKYYVALGK